MARSRTAAEWMILILNVPAVLLGIVLGWIWISDAIQHYVAGDDEGTIRLGMSVGFLICYLTWNTLVTTYLLWRRPISAPSAEKPKAPRSAVAVAPPVTVPIPARKVNAPPAPARPVIAAPPPATPTPEWVNQLAEVHAEVPDPAALPNPPPASWISDVARAEQASRPTKE
jgi:hypothetical protein